MKKSFLFFALLLLLFPACKQKTAESVPDVQGIDNSIKPGDNFFMYVNRTWYDTVQIPASQSGVGAYMFMNYPQRLRLLGILDSVSKAKNTAGSIEQKLGDFYASGMDTVTINNRGYDPIKPVLARIEALKDINGLVNFLAEEARTQNNSLLSFGIGPDDKNSSINIAHLSQTGIGLPDRDYYFKTDAPIVAIQQAYKTYLSTLFHLIGVDTAASKKNGELVYHIEQELATSHKTRIELRDVKANYNKMSIADLTKQQPAISWPNLLAKLGATIDSIDVSQPAYYEKLNAALKSIPISDWKTYLTAHTLSGYAPLLSKSFTDAAFAFNKVVSGQAVQKARGETIANAVDNLLGQALGQLYVSKYFTEAAKKRVLELVNNLQQAFAARIDKLDWMGDSTKQKAKDKLFAITKKIGYPDKWREYNQVTISREKYFENVVSATSNNYQFQLAKLNKPVDKTEWFISPSTVTAYYNPSANEIVFPAAILQSPYFDEHADDALNYGGVGMVIGHEMTHAFDDQGAQYDKYGNVQNWWTPDDYQKFKAKTQQVINLYNSFTVLDTVHVKGAMTVGENTADIGGVAIAYDAFKMTTEGHDTAVLGAFTPDQRFFISVANIWRVKMKDEFLRLWINNNPHAPPVWRVNSPLMNNPHFYEAFHVSEGDKLYKAEKDRVRIW